MGVVCVCVCHDPCAETGFGTGRSRSLCSTEWARVHERMRKCRASVCNHVCKCLCVCRAQTRAITVPWRRDAHNHSALAAQRTHARVGRGIRLRTSERVCASASVVAFLCPFACSDIYGPAAGIPDWFLEAQRLPAAHCHVWFPSPCPWHPL